MRKRAKGGTRQATTCLNLSWKKNLKTLKERQKTLANIYPLTQYFVTNPLFNKTGCYFVLSNPSPHSEALITSTASGGFRLR